MEKLNNLQFFFSRKLILFSTLIFSISLFPQNSQEKIDNLKKDLATTSDSRKKANIYSDLTWYYGNISIDSALSYGQKALRESTLLKDSTLIAQVNSDIASVYFNKSDFKNSEKYYLTALNIRVKRNDILGVNKIKVNLGNVYRKTFRHEKAMQNYIVTLKYFEEKNILPIVNAIKGNMALVFTDTKNYEKAKKYLTEAIAYFEEKNDLNRLCEDYMNMGQVYQFQKQYNDAEIFYKKSLEKCTQASNKRGISYAYRNLGTLGKLQNKDSLAQINLLKSSKLRQEFNSPVDIASIKSEEAKSFSESSNYHKAKNLLLKQIKVLENEKSYKNLQKFYPQLVQAYSHLGKPDSADYYLTKYENVTEITGKESVAKQTSELETKYQTAKKDNQILAQKSKIFRRNVTLFSLLGLLLFGFIYYRNYRHKQKITLQKEILHQQDLATKAVMEAEDNERKRMAIHLHDGVGQLLTATNMNLQVIKEFKNDDAAFEKLFLKTQNILRDAMVEVRTLSHQIMPNMLIRNSLSNALKELIEKVDSPKLHINLKIDGLKDDLDENIQVVVFRVIQECINNTIKHADASEILLNLLQTEQFIEAKFQDNGKGFNVKNFNSKSEGMGLENIKSRIEFLKGEFKIASSEGNGTQIFVKIPLKK